MMPEHREDHPRSDDLQAWMDGQLEHGQADRIARHIVGCPACAGRAQALRQLFRLLQALPEAQPAHDLAPAIINRLAATRPRRFSPGLILSAQALVAAALVLATADSGWPVAAFVEKLLPLPLDGRPLASVWAASAETVLGLMAHAHALAQGALTVGALDAARLVAVAAGLLLGGVGNLLLLARAARNPGGLP